MAGQFIYGIKKNSRGIKKKELKKILGAFCYLNISWGYSGASLSAIAQLLYVFSDAKKWQWK